MNKATTTDEAPRPDIEAYKQWIEEGDNDFVTVGRKPIIDILAYALALEKENAILTKRLQFLVADSDNQEKRIAALLSAAKYGLDLVRGSMFLAARAAVDAEEGGGG